ncbi:MAG: HEAT repeat domain-containing protein [Lentisphaeraceae bacterium]|nr:HEAT repeat domain-containing protein [Lentisphaeraceae bacterium]
MVCKRISYLLLTLLISLSIPISSIAQKKKLSAKEYEAKAAVRIKNFTYPKEMKIDLWADESQTTNPSAFYFDSKGRMYVAEIHRWRKGVDDIRNRRYMLLEDLSIQSSEDRMKMFKNHFDKHPLEWYTKESSEIRLLEDKDGDGRADFAKLYAGGFNDPLDGPGIGLIERDGKIYYTNIPHLWMLEDTNGDGVADKRKSLQDGFGIRMSFSGHDMHGLVWGPDGKLYWSIGDRGYSIKTKEGKKFHGPNEGAVFRCDPDGSNVEVFYDRLRNPQEMAFDDYGNLFTADNDGDKSDVERINYIVEGGDSGWNAGHQAIMSFTSDYNFRSYAHTGDKSLYNPWETEVMWKVRDPRQPQFILPGIGQIIGGPSGFCFNPGNSLGEKYNDKFFVIHYRGSLSATNVTMFDINDDGAGFKTANHQPFFKGSNCVDIDFGPDGKMYISDYNYGGWTNQNVGNIYTIYDPVELKKTEVAENKKYLTSDYSKISTKELVQLLARDHRDIRYKAQFELAKRGSEGTEAFMNAAKGTGNTVFTRIHGVWGLGMMARKDPALLTTVLGFLKDENDQVRIQAARVLGDHKFKPAVADLVKALNDKHPRVAMYAGIGLGRIGDNGAVDTVFDALKKNDNKDLFLRHGLIMYLAGIKDKSAYIKGIKDSSPAVRMAVLLTLRRHKDAQVADFLSDSDVGIRYEAIRAINDLHMTDVIPELAKELAKYFPGTSAPMPKDSIDEFIHHRIINANYYSAKSADAERILKYAANDKLPEGVRLEALSAIEGWNDKHPLDTTTGLPTAQPKDREDIKAAVQANLGEVFKTAKGKVLAQCTRLAMKYGYEIKSEILLGQLNNPGISLEVREEALNSLVSRKAQGLEEVVSKLLSDKNQGLRLKALEALMKLNPAKAVPSAVKLAQSGSLKDKQNAYSLIGDQDNAVVNSLLIGELDKILKGQGNSPTMLDVIEAAAKNPNADVKAKLAEYNKSIPPTDMMKKFRPSLNGGDIERGKDVFLNHGAAQCVRCHVVNGFGADVGPNLSEIGKTQSREYILQAIVDPGAVVAKGFGMVTIKLKNGQSVAGMLSNENNKEITLKSMDGKEKKYAKANIVEQQPPISGMPPMQFLLKPSEVRDLVAYLHSLKKAKKMKSH